MDQPFSWSVIDRLWERLIASYGKRFMDQYQGLEIDAVRSIWHRELRAYLHKDKMGPMAWALDNLPEQPINAIQFRNLCHAAPAKQESLKLPPKPDPVRLAAELAKLAEAKASIRRDGVAQGKEWIQILIERAERGERLSSGQKRMLKQALRE